QVLRVFDFICGDDPGADRATAVQAFPQEELLVPLLQVACGQVIDDRIAEYLRQGFAFKDVSATTADDNSQFCFPIALLRHAFLERDIGKRASDGRNGLGEHDEVFWSFDVKPL